VTLSDGWMLTYAVHKVITYNVMMVSPFFTRSIGYKCQDNFYRVTLLSAEYVTDVKNVEVKRIKKRIK